MTLTEYKSFITDFRKTVYGRQKTSPSIAFKLISQKKKAFPTQVIVLTGIIRWGVTLT
jgi:hypothetical protein